MARFTADRAGLLACQDVSLATTPLLKVAGLPNEHLTPPVIEEFVRQAREFDANGFDNLDKLTKLLSFMEQRYSWTVMRASELLKWVDSQEYKNVLEGILPTHPTEPSDTLSPDPPEHWNFLSSW